LNKQVNLTHGNGVSPHFLLTERAKLYEMIPDPNSSMWKNKTHLSSSTDNSVNL